jgi:hypothetical protein
MFKIRHVAALTLSCVMCCLSARPAMASVVVTIDGNVAHADISLDNGVGHTYQAEVTITFGAAVNLDVDTLNLTAELVNPAALASRLPPGISVDPAFPMLITVEPPSFAWLFASGFDNAEDGSGDLSFLNTYEFEVHTHELTYAANSPYRVIKAPIGGNFHDFTEDVLPGSVRARGREGAFSQFLVGRDSNTNVLTMLLVATNKLLALQLRVVAAALNNLLNGDLIGLLAVINADLLALDLTGAIANLDQFIAEVEAHAGIDIPNQWNSRHDVVNDAGEILGLAQTLRFTLVGLQTAPLL